MFKRTLMAAAMAAVPFSAQAAQSAEDLQKQIDIGRHLDALPVPGPARNHEAACSGAKCTAVTELAAFVAGSACRAFVRSGRPVSNGPGGPGAGGAGADRYGDLESLPPFIGPWGLNWRCFAQTIQIPAKESALPVESRDTIPMIVQCS